jgi:hypothetical protein
LAPMKPAPPVTRIMKSPALVEKNRLVAVEPRLSHRGVFQEVARDPSLPGGPKRG